MSRELPEVFFEVHSGLPREGPGDPAFTRRAFACLRDLPERPQILDLGCGSGAQTLELASLCRGTIVAVDNHEPFLEQLRTRAAQLGLADRVEARLGDMTALPFECGSFDLIWAEGSIFVVGFAAGLSAWRPLLSEPGYIAVTEACWLKPEVPREVREFWNAVYPAIRGIPETQEMVRSTGYDLVESFVLPDSAWWNYYSPIERKLPGLETRHAGDPQALAVLTAERKEIDMFRRFSDCYGYVFFVARRR
jgi:SAM-dependent methyltransferase